MTGSANTSPQNLPRDPGEQAKLHTLGLHPKDVENCLMSQPGQGKRILSVPHSPQTYKRSWADALRCRQAQERCLAGMGPSPPAPSQAENGLTPWLEGGRDLFKKPTSTPRRRAEGVKGVLPCPREI